MPRLKIEEFTGEDRTWLGSTHGLANARTATLDVAAFTQATHYPDGYFPSGIPVNTADEGAVKPWTGAQGERLGFLATSQAVDGQTKIPAPILRHGTIKVDMLPVDFTIPADPPGQFAFIGGTQATPTP